MQLNITLSTRPIIALVPLELMGRDSAWASIASGLRQHDETLMTRLRQGGMLNLGRWDCRDVSPAEVGHEPRGGQARQAIRWRGDS